MAKARGPIQRAMAAEEQMDFETALQNYKTAGLILLKGKRNEIVIKWQAKLEQKALELLDRAEACKEALANPELAAQARKRQVTKPAEDFDELAARIARLDMEGDEEEPLLVAPAVPLGSAAGPAPFPQPTAPPPSFQADVASPSTSYVPAYVPASSPSPSSSGMQASVQPNMQPDSQSRHTYAQPRSIQYPSLDPHHQASPTPVSPFPNQPGFNTPQPQATAPPLGGLSQGPSYPSQPASAYQQAAASSSQGPTGLLPSSLAISTQLPMMEFGGSRGIGTDCPPRGKVGLANLANTCYLNSALQCIASTGPVVALLQQPHLQLRPNPVMRELRSLVMSLLRLPDKSKLFPEQLLLAIKQANSQFLGAQQQDAMSVYQAVLTSLHEATNRVVAPAPGAVKVAKVVQSPQQALAYQPLSPSSPTSPTHPPTAAEANLVRVKAAADKRRRHAPRAAAKALNDAKAIDNSPITDLFDYLLEMTIYCQQPCRQVVRIRHEVGRYVIPLPLTEKAFQQQQGDRFAHSMSVTDCLSLFFTQNSPLPGYRCPECGKTDTAFQTTRLHPPYPAVLVLQIKRRHSTGKTTSRVHFPEQLDLSSYIAPSATGRKLVPPAYDLYAVVNHIDGAPPSPPGQRAPSPNANGRTDVGNSGHYTAFAKAGQSGNDWFSFDDSSVLGIGDTSISITEYLAKTPLIVGAFYRLRNSPGHGTS